MNLRPLGCGGEPWGCSPDLQQPRLISPITVGCVGRAWGLPPAGSPQHSQPAPCPSAISHQPCCVCITPGSVRAPHCPGEQRDAAAAGQDEAPSSITPWLQPLSLGCPGHPGAACPWSPAPCHPAGGQETKNGAALASLRCTSPVCRSVEQTLAVYMPEAD